MDKRSTQLEILVKNTEAMLNVAFQGEFSPYLKWGCKSGMVHVTCTAAVLSFEVRMGDMTEEKMSFQ